MNALLKKSLPVLLALGLLGGLWALLYSSALSMFTQLLVIAWALFCLGLYGVLTCHSLLKALISLELVLNASVLAAVASSHYLEPQMLDGQLVAVFIMALAAAEVALGLALAIVIYRQQGTDQLTALNQLSG